jgi:hypothetical protein
MCAKEIITILIAGLITEELAIGKWLVYWLNHSFWSEGVVIL